MRALAEAGPPRMGWDGIGAVREDREAVARHLDAVLALPLIDVAAIRARGFHVALDCVRGAGASAIPPLLERLGCRVSGINLEPDGRFPRPPEPVPENLGELGALVRRSGADIGLAVDPDVDRLALVDERGRPIGEDYTLAFAVRAVLDRRTSSRESRHGRREPLDQPGRGGCGPRRGRPVRARAGGRGQRGARHARRGRGDRRRRERRRHASRAAHRARRAPGGGLDLASPCHVWGYGVAAGGSVARDTRS